MVGRAKNKKILLKVDGDLIDDAMFSRLPAFSIKNSSS